MAPARQRRPAWKLVEGSPGLRRQAVARHAGDAVDVVQQTRQPQGLLGRRHQAARQLLDQRDAGALPVAGQRAVLGRQQALESRAARRQVLPRGAVLLQPAEAGAQHAHAPVGALRVAAEPEQVLGGPAGQLLHRAPDAGGLHRRPPEAGEGRRRRLADDPDIARLPVGGAERHGPVRIDRHGQAARQDGKSAVCRRHEQAQRVRLWHKPGRGQGRRGAEAGLGLGDQRGAAQLDLLQQGVALLRPRDARDRCPAPPGPAAPCPRARCG